MKNGIIATLVAIAAATAICGCTREDARTAAENAKTSIGELVTPEAGNPDETLVVRKAQLKERRRQNTTWTDENITAHPDLYLAQCKEDITFAIAQYDALLLSMRKIKSASERAASESAGEAERMGRFIDEAKPFVADDATAYPVTVSGFSFTKDQLMKKLRKAITDRSRASENEAKAKARAKVAQFRIDKLDAQKEAAKDALKLVEDKIVEVKANKVLNGVDGVRASVNGILDTAVNLGAGDGELPDDVLGLPTAADDNEKFVREALGL